MLSNCPTHLPPQAALTRLALERAAYYWPGGVFPVSAAPNSLEELRAMETRLNGACEVWDGASEGTIWGEPAVNYAFRAWHDAVHLKTGAAFTLAGEIAVAHAQIAEIFRLYRREKALASALAFAVAAEVIGQASYFEKNGQFPDDQIYFARFCVSDPGMRRQLRTHVAIGRKLSHENN